MFPLFPFPPPILSVDWWRLTRPGRVLAPLAGPGGAACLRPKAWTLVKFAPKPEATVRERRARLAAPLGAQGAAFCDRPGGRSRYRAPARCGADGWADGGGLMLKKKRSFFLSRRVFGLVLPENPWHDKNPWQILNGFLKIFFLKFPKFPNPKKFFFFKNPKFFKNPRISQNF